MRKQKNNRLTAILLALICSGCGKPMEMKPDNTPVPEPTVTADNQQEYDRINETLDSFLHDGDTLFANEDGSAISWEVESGHAEITDNVIHKTEDAGEYEPVVLRARTDSGYYRFDHLLLLDPVAGYVMSYFTPEGEGSEALKMVYTYDGLMWFNLNQDQPILKPVLGTARMRDPAFLRKKDGSFALLATQGYDNPEIYVYDSQDLTSFDNERLVMVNHSGDSLSMSEKQAWAPEGFYDRTKDQYVIYWSSVEDQGMYYNLSDDLNAFTDPKKLLDPGFPVIDGTLIKWGHDWTVILKDERDPMEEYSQLFEGFGDSWDSISEFTEPIWDRHQVEGPFAIRALDQPAWYLYCDDYTRGSLHVIYTPDMKEFIPMDDINLNLHVNHPAHGNAIGATQKEIDRLKAAYGTSEQ